MCKFNLKYVFLLPLFFLFLPAFCLPLGFKNLVVYYLVSFVAFVVYLVLNYSKIIKTISYLYKHGPIKYFVYFLIWYLFSSVILLISGKYAFNVFLYYLYALIFIDYFLTFILPSLLYKRDIFNIRFFIKALIIAYYLIFIIGLIEFIGKCSGINILVNIVHLLANQRFLDGKSYAELQYIDRVCSVFAEPAWFVNFIYINLPIIYRLAKTKYRIFKIKKINIVLKKTLIPLTIISILIAQSTIWFLFCVILFVFLQKDRLLAFCQNNKLSLLFGSAIFLVVLLITLNNLDLSLYSDSYYYRIIIFLNNMFDFSSIVNSIPSLGTRLVSYKATLIVAKDNLLLGVGLGNLQYIIAPVLFNMDVLTGENISNLQNFYLITNKMAYNGTILFQYLAELGIIGIALFYLFLYKSVNFLNKIQKYFCGLKKDFLVGVKQSIIAIAVVLFYGIGEADYYIWFIFGLVNIFILEKFSSKITKNGD